VSGCTCRLVIAQLVYILLMIPRKRRMQKLVPFALIFLFSHIALCRHRSLFYIATFFHRHPTSVNNFCSYVQFILFAAASVCRRFYVSNPYSLYPSVLSVQLSTLQMPSARPLANRFDANLPQPSPAVDWPKTEDRWPRPIDHKALRASCRRQLGRYPLRTSDIGQATT
jgi:hypothetical protein